ncbi:MAG: DUF4178 domain-containing protein [Kofleriaceae bacterium]|nr:DUF4178 domain-containing protein [Kofleriaceae bacterium]
MQRTDRGVDSLGKVADLVPMDSPLRLFADGQLGSQTFILVGMAQLRHSAGGLTQEWYAKFSGTWGWLAEAQGRYYMTFEAEGAKLPPIGSLSPGAQLQLPNMLGVTKTYTVGEVGSATYVAATGELPFRLVPEGSYRFVDLADGEGNFATIDYGEPGDEPALYIGQQLSLADLHITGGEVGPSREAQVRSSRLACPNCNAPIELHTSETQRAVCAHCNTLLDINAGSLQVLGKLATKAQPRIPLGAKGRFLEGEMTVIGYIGRSAQIEGDWYPFEEYLLYAPNVGFRWLVESDGHWSYVQPVATGAVKFEGGDATYEGVKLRLFQSAQLRVDNVLGEVYWKVQAGEMSRGDDFVAPPAMLSRETSGGEETWSLSTYLKVDEVERAFGKTPLQVRAPIGVAPNQVNPAGNAATPLTLSFLALLLLGIVFAVMAPATQKYQTEVTIHPGQPVASESSDGSNVFFSDPFKLEAGKNVELAFRTNLANNWAYVVASLVNTNTGDVVTADASMEYYSGVEDGESWSEGNQSASKVVSPVPAGDYALRLEMQHGATTGDVPMTVRVRQGVFRGRYLAIALGALGIPFLIIGIYSYSFERKRWTNSSQGPSGAPKTPLTILVGGIVMLLGGIVVILKAFGSSSDD